MLADLPYSQLFIFLIALIVSVALHEAMHGYMAYWLGDTTALDAGRLTLNPLASIDIVTTIALPLILVLLHQPPFFAAKPVPFNPNRVKFGEYGAALVGLAGPATNLLLAAIGGLVFRGLASNGSTAIANGLELFVEINVALCIFNLIPVPPLDGSRALYAIAPEPVQHVMEQIEATGFLAIIAIVFVLYQFIGVPISNLEVHIANLLLGTN
jgi:Zn-dependent protease